jgi:translation initiation factor 3 subunit A
MSGMSCILAGLTVRIWLLAELMNVGQKQAALQALHDLITSKRYRAWQKTLEKIMFKYVELCVDMKKGRFAKDGLIQYRIVCQQVNVSSLEEVIKYFLQLSSERAEAAQAQAAAAEVTLDVEDLEAEKRPEDLMLSYVSGEKGKERSDRETVTPWFKFLWETYRTVLEILRNNSKLESLYAVSISSVQGHPLLVTMFDHDGLWIISR